MAKLYAEISSDKGGRVASKGGNDFITCNISDGNNIIISIEYNKSSHQLHINDETKKLTYNLDGYIT